MAGDINLDDIISELSNLGAQLDIQSEQFSKVSTQIKAHEFGADNDLRASTSNPSCSLFFSTGAPTSASQSATVTRSNSRLQNGDALRRNFASERDGRRSVDFDISSNKGKIVAESARVGLLKKTGDDRNDNANGKIDATARWLDENHVGVTQRQSRDSAIYEGAGVTVSGSSSRNSAQSFGSDWSDPQDARQSELTSGIGSTCDGVLGPSESMNSFATSSSLDSHGSTSSGHSGASPRVVSRVESAEQMSFTIYSPDGSSRTIVSSSRCTGGQLCDILVKENGVEPKASWSLVEQVYDLFMERIIEDHQLVADVVDCWVKDSSNRLIFADIPQKYAMLSNPQLSFENDTYVPDVEGVLYLKAEGKKSWKKLYFVLRASGLYYSTKGKGKSTADLVCLQSLRDIEIFTAVNWKKKHHSPTDFGFALKTAMVQKSAPKYIKYLCAEDNVSLWKWISSLRLAKHGKTLLSNYKRTQKCSSTGKLSRSSTLIDRSRAHSSDQLDSFTTSDNAVTNGQLSIDRLANHTNGNRIPVETRITRQCDTIQLVNSNSDAQLNPLADSNTIDQSPSRGGSRIRSSSIDRLLEDNSNTSCERRNKYRSNSIDRLLDSGSCGTAIMRDFIGEGEEFDYSTVRRASRLANPDLSLDKRQSCYRSTVRDSMIGGYSESSAKMVPRLPITTTVTKQMSMQQPYDVRTLPRPPKKPRPSDTENCDDEQRFSHTSEKNIYSIEVSQTHRSPPSWENRPSLTSPHRSTMSSTSKSETMPPSFNVESRPSITNHHVHTNQIFGITNGNSTVRTTVTDTRLPVVNGVKRDVDIDSLFAEDYRHRMQSPQVLVNSDKRKEVVVDMRHSIPSPAHPLSVDPGVPTGADWSTTGQSDDDEFERNFEATLENELDAVEQTANRFQVQMVPNKSCAEIHPSNHNRHEKITSASSVKNNTNSPVPGIPSTYHSSSSVVSNEQLHSSVVHQQQILPVASNQSQSFLDNRCHVPVSKSVQYDMHALRNSEAAKFNLHENNVARTVATTAPKPKPPAPPKRMESTRLSTVTSGYNGTGKPETRYFINDLDRVIAQKYENGVDGVSNLEVPLPPPPPVILEDLTLINFDDLPPPPPADLLAGLRTIRRNAPPPQVLPKRK